MKPIIYPAWPSRAGKVGQPCLLGEAGVLKSQNKILHGNLYSNKIILFWCMLLSKLGIQAVGMCDM